MYGKVKSSVIMWYIVYYHWNALKTKYLLKRVPPRQSLFNKFQILFWLGQIYLVDVTGKIMPYWLDFHKYKYINDSNRPYDNITTGAQTFLSQSLHESRRQIWPTSFIHYIDVQSQLAQNWKRAIWRWQTYIDMTSWHYLQSFSDEAWLLPSPLGKWNIFGGVAYGDLQITCSWVLSIINGVEHIGIRCDVVQYSWMTNYARCLISALTHIIQRLV